ncbi:hypothetical protein BROOK1789C_1158 [Bathymodiolus brooksi thiotrophic gill symbiont]|nr:hypothetical protein BROOK1789C_1158 [Bathymodiolus brooksi thiotrophic gill symbiont]
MQASPSLQKLTGERKGYKPFPTYEGGGNVCGALLGFLFSGGFVLKLDFFCV